MCRSRRHAVQITQIFNKKHPIFQGNEKHLSEQFQNSYRAITEQFQSSFRAIIEQLQSSFRAIPESVIEFIKSKSRKNPGADPVPFRSSFGAT